MDREQFQDMAMAGDAPLSAVGASAPEREAFLVRARAFEKRARTVVQPLTTGFPWPTVLSFVAVYASVALVAMLVLKGYLSYWVSVPLDAILIYFIFTPLHEAAHGNIAGRNRGFWLFEEFIGHGSGFLLLAPFPGFRVVHLHHHANTNDPVEDPDYWVKSRTWLGNVLRSMVIQPVFILHLWRLARDPRTLRAFIWEMVYVAIYAAIVFAAFQTGIGRELILLWLLPGYIGVVLVPIMFDWPAHHPHTERGRYTDSAILLFPPPFRTFMDFIFCGHTYHLMHHLYPRVPFYHYRAAWEVLKDDLAALGPKVREFRI